jgi:glycosyltransferase involved in cell wall biosynthesis
MRVFLTSADNPYQQHLGGKHIHQLLFEKALGELGYEKDVLYPVISKRNKVGTALRLAAHFLPLNVLGYLKLRFEVSFKEKFNKESIPFIDNNYDIVHAQDPLSLLYTKHIKCRKRFVTLHGYFTKETINYSKLPVKFIQKFTCWGMDMEKQAYSLADFFVCADNTIKEYLISEFGISPDKITVIFNAIDTEKFSPPLSSEITNIRKSYGIEETQYLILVPRRLVKKNGVHMAVRAMKQIHDQNIVLLIAGDGPERHMIEAESAGDSRIRLLGAVDHDQIIDYFKITDTVLIPSITSDGFQEATSLAMLEGMSMKKPTVCSAIGGMKEVIKHNETGFLVEEQNPEAIAAQILWIMQHSGEVAKIVTNARNYILENHHYLSHARKITRLYTL